VTTDRPQSILAHLNELRWRVLKAGLGVIVAGVVCFFFVDRLRELLESPFHVAAPEAYLQTFAVAEQWAVFMRIGLFGGLIVGSPVVLYQMWAFVAPALNPKEKKWAFPIVGALVLLFVTGVVFGYSILPRGLDFLLGIFPDVENDLRLAEYYSFVLRFLLAFGIAFMYPVFLFAAAAVGAIRSETLARGRRWAVLIVVTASALITPTGDVFTLLALSVPLYLMYEGTYWLIRLTLKK
jgi:sec-independent protein translocase protein TatC